MKKTLLIFFWVVLITVIGSCGSYWLFSNQILEPVTLVTAIAFPSLVGLATGLLIRGTRMRLYCSLGLVVGVADYVGTALIHGSFSTPHWLSEFGIFFVGQPLMFLVSAIVGGWIGRRYFHVSADSALSSRIAVAPSRLGTSRPENGARDIALPEPQPSLQPKTPRTPVFMFTAVLGFVACLFTPTIIVVFPILGTIAFAVISLFRRERARVVSGVVLVATVGLLILSSNPLRAVEIASWSWEPDPGDPQLGIKGYNTWNVQVRNISHWDVDRVGLELTTYDESGAVVKTEFTHVWRIAPGGSRSNLRLTDYYGTEKRAALQVTLVELRTPRLSQ